MDKIRIKINIGNRTYPLVVNPEDEAQVKRAADMVNDKLRSYVDTYSVADQADLLSMCALFFATEMARINEQQEREQSELADKLARIEALIDKGL